jgi:hypothetical protein
VTKSAVKVVSANKPMSARRTVRQLNNQWKNPCGDGLSIFGMSFINLPDGVAFPFKS